LGEVYGSYTVTKKVVGVFVRFRAHMAATTLSVKGLNSYYYAGGILSNCSQNRDSFSFESQNMSFVNSYRVAKNLKSSLESSFRYNIFCNSMLLKFNFSNKATMSFLNID
jgi:hypothetical protein